jgi:serine phosphatase RsbU (regulator of sigma subunit)
MSPAELEVKPPGAPPFRVPIEPVPFTIGRSPDNHLVLRDNRASRSHALIRRSGNEFVVEDCGSRNGVEVNGARVKAEVLRHGDIIRFGIDDSYELIFWSETGSGTTRTQTHHGGLRKLRSMLEVARSLQGVLSIDHVLAAVVDAALEITACERGFLLLVQDGKLQTRIARSGGRTLSDDIDVPKSMISRALQNRSELFTMRVEEEGGLDTSMTRLSLRSVVCVPLLKVRTGELSETAVIGTVADTIGMLYLDSRQRQSELTGTSRDLVQSLAIEASFIIENARLLEEERKKQQIEQELRIAHAIQKDLLPDASHFPKAGWLTGAGLSISSREVGGDYFDLVRISPERFDVVVSDVSGKGVSSALLAGLLQGAFIMSTGEAVTPSLVYHRLNQFLLERTSGEKYATMFLARILQDGTMQWSNAGHCVPLIFRRTGEIFELAPTGMPVGMLEEGVWRDAHTQLVPGDVVAFYTDGITDATNLNRLEYGLTRMVTILSDHRLRPPGAIVDALHRDITSFIGEAPQRDDMTLLILRYYPE